MILTIDLDEYFIEVPLVPRSRAAATKLVCEGLTKLEAPLSNRLIGERNATHPHDLFNIAKAQSETEGEPDRVADDLGGEAMAAVEIRSGVHQRSMSQCQVYSTLASLS